VALGDAIGGGRRLCISIAEPSLAAARAAIERVRGEDAVVELRIDKLASSEERVLDALGPFVSSLGTPIVATYRRERDGGSAGASDAERLELVAALARLPGVACDVELDCAWAVERYAIARSRLLLSYHDFEGTPDLPSLFDEMASHEAACYKIATRAASFDDTLAHFDLVERARARRVSLVAIAMGARGLATRVLGPAWGSELTFCAVSRATATAPGQLTVDEARRTYRVERLTPETLVTGLVGGHLGYSRSPAMQNGAFAEAGIDGVYVPFEIDDVAGFVEAVLGPRRRVAWRVAGIGVTSPFKTAIVDALDALDETAARAGAVNTVVVDGSRLVGFNTDVEGAIRPLERRAGSLAGATVGILGAGGAARAVPGGLARRGARATVFARDLARAAPVAERFGARLAPLSRVGESRLDVLVNATPAGTDGVASGELPIDARALERVRFVYDLVYAPERTPLLAAAERAGAATLGGLEMLATQAAIQFELWTGRQIEPERMLAAARAG
jgi:3-dehydroquinate dehydratase/shikimate dehydrogenase